MTDEELIARLRDTADHARFEPHLHHAAADLIEEYGRAYTHLLREFDKRGDRIEALVKEMDFAMMTGHDLAKMEYRDLVNDLEARAEQLAETNKRLEAALKRVLRNVDEDGVGTVLMIDLIHARAALKGDDHE